MTMYNCVHIKIGIIISMKIPCEQLSGMFGAM